MEKERKKAGRTEGKEKRERKRKEGKKRKNNDHRHFCGFLFNSVMSTLYVPMSGLWPISLAGLVHVWSSSVVVVGDAGPSCDSKPCPETFTCFPERFAVSCGLLYCATLQSKIKYFHTFEVWTFTQVYL